MTQKSQPTALISVFHKDGITEFAKRLAALGWKILASGGTATHLANAGIAVTNVADIVGKPILGHRVVTLSREVHAGLLSRPIPEDQQELEENDIEEIGLVCVDLYPLEEEIAKPDATLESVLEKMDIGGPTMLSSGSKGQRIVICDPDDREDVLQALESDGMSDDLREYLAAKADFVVSRYRALTADYRSGGKFKAIHGERILECLYGENAWQAPAALYSTGANDPLGLDKFKLVGGTAPSYNNICDHDRLLQTITHVAAGLEKNALLEEYPFIALVVKHGNVCGAACGRQREDVVRAMVRGDLRAIMGGVVMTNFAFGNKEADILLHDHIPVGKSRLIDEIIAPGFVDDAVNNLSRKKGKCRLLENPHLEHLGLASLDTTPRFRYVRGGFLFQPNYTWVPDFRSEEEIVCYGPARSGPSQLLDLVLSWAIGSTSNSNTIALVKDGQLIGLGVGQQERVGAGSLAVTKAKRSHHDLQGATAYSDSFFPFDDGPRVLIEAGVTTIFTTSGSVNDNDTIRLCNEHDITLYMVPDKIGRGFYGH